ncbi:MAG: AsmA-like C-terminal domain-containing protein [Pseudomonadota bacterium]
MAFRASRRPQPASGMGRLWSGCCTASSLFCRAVLSLATLAVIAVVVLVLRLQQGPLEIPGAAALIEDQINSETEQAQVAITSAILSLGADGTSSGLQLKDVIISDPQGKRMLDVERVGIRFALADLMMGRVQPQRIVVFAPDAQLTRSRTGALHFQMGQGSGLVLAEGSASKDEVLEDAEVFERFVDMLTGDIPAPSALSQLERVSLRGARLTFDDRLNGGRWSSQNASIVLQRDEDGARGIISVAVIDNGTPGAAVRLTASRQRGAEEARLRAQFGRLRTQVLSGQLPALAWMSVLEGTVEGWAEARIDRDGRVTAVDGVLVSEQGRLRGVGAVSAYDIAQVRFSADPQANTVSLEQVTLAAPAVDARFSGIAQLRRGSDGEAGSMVAQFEVEALDLRLPSVFPDALAFDDGQINVRWNLGQGRIEVAQTRLARDDLMFLVDGRLHETEGGWITDLRAEAVNMTVQDLLAHWPHAAATNARSWIEENIPEATLPQFLAQMRFGEDEPRLSLDFQYADLKSFYIPGMPPIEGARGRGHMTYHDLYLEMDEGRVTPPGGEAISLAGSSIDILHFWGEVTPAKVDLRAAGRTADVLALINQPPLNLVDKLGIDLGQVGGDAQVVAALDFPLISDLLVEDVGADATAELNDLAIAFDVRGNRLPVRARRLSLQANTRGMRLSGPVDAAGATLTLDWRENYGATPSTRTIALAGQTTDAVLALLGAGPLPLDRPVSFDLRLSQTGRQVPSFALSTDLTPARLTVDDLNWAKPAGTPGSLAVEGRLGEGLEITGFDLSAGALKAQGAIDLTAEGALRGAQLDRLIVPGIADVAGSIEIGQDGVPDIRLTSGSVDLSNILSAETEGESQPFRLALTLDRVAVSNKIVFGATSGRFTQQADGARTGVFDALMDGRTPVNIAIDGEPGGRTELRLATNDAGAVLGAADIYRGAKGGRMTLDAVIGAAGEVDIAGRVRIEDVIVRSESTFRDVLRDGGLSDAESEVTGGGIRFRKIWIPFAYEDGVITVEDAIAASPALALKVNGTLDEESENMDLVGVLSPAYALTGALNEIPILGQVLSGGEGEGILAMTFTLTGRMRDPDLAVNPLSILAPGFLRGVFEGRARVVDPDFTARIGEPDR